MHRLRFRAKGALLFLGCLVLSACGGSGSDDAGSGSGTGGGGTHLIIPPPPASDLGYKGKQEAFVYVPENAGAALSMLLIARDLLLDSRYTLLEEIDGLPGERFTQVIAGAEGQVTVSGTASRLYFKYEKFDSGDGIVMDGGVVESIEDSGYDVVKEIHYHDLTISNGGARTFFAGSIRVTEEDYWTTAPESTRFNANLLIDTPSIGEMWLRDFEMTVSEPRHDEKVLEHVWTGRIYHEALGYVSIEVSDWREQRWTWRRDAMHGPPLAGDTLRFADSPMRLLVLNEYFAALEYDADGDGTFESGNRLTWFDLVGIGEEVSSPLDDRLIAVAAGPYRTSSDITLTGLFSHAPEGRLLTYEWKVLSAPGAPLLTEFSSPRINLGHVTDGEYLVQLTVSDGEDVRTDTIRVDRWYQSSHYILEPGGIADPDSDVGIGKTVHLDGRTHGAVSLRSPGRFRLHAPEGSKVELPADRIVTSFIPDVSGLYIIELIVDGRVRDVVPLYVDTPLAFHRGSAYRTPFNDVEADSFLLDDLNADEAVEIIVRTNDKERGKIRWTNQDSYVGPPPLGKIAHADSNSFAVIENGDGDSRDLIAHGWDSIRLVPRANAYTVEYSHSTGNCDYTTATSDVIAAGDVNGDGLADLVSTLRCHGLIDVHLGTLPSGFLPAVPWSVGSVDRLALADLDQDGYADLVFSAAASVLGSGSGIAVALSNGDGTFQAPEVLVSSGMDVPYFVVGSVSGEAHGIVTSAAGALRVLSFGATGAVDSIETIAAVSPLDRVEITDLNGDGAADIIVTHVDTASGASLFLQVENGWHRQSLPAEVFEDLSVIDSRPIKSTDLDGDGISDLIYSRNDGAIGILLGR